MKKATFLLKAKQIPIQLTESQFNQFILPWLSVGSRGPNCCIPLRKVFKYILKVIYTGIQWKELPIDKDMAGKPEIHHTRIFRIYQRWVNDSSLQNVFENSVRQLADHQLLDCSILHGDGSL